MVQARAFLATLGRELLRLPTRHHAPLVLGGDFNAGKETPRGMDGLYELLVGRRKVQAYGCSALPNPDPDPDPNPNPNPSPNLTLTLSLTLTTDPNPNPNPDPNLTLTLTLTLSLTLILTLPLPLTPTPTLPLILTPTRPVPRGARGRRRCGDAPSGVGQGLWSARRGAAWPEGVGPLRGGLPRANPYPNPHPNPHPHPSPNPDPHPN